MNRRGLPSMRARGVLPPPVWGPLHGAISCPSGGCVPPLPPHTSLLGHGWLASRVVGEGDADACPAMTLHLEVSAELIHQGKDQFKSE
jgi:hypothetical protein